MVWILSAVAARRAGGGALLSVALALGACAPLPVSDTGEDGVIVEERPVPRGPAPQAPEEETPAPVYEEEVRMPPLSPAVQSLLNAADAAEAGGDLTQAGRLRERAQRLAPRHPVVYQAMIHQAVASGDCAQASALAGRAGLLGLEPAQARRLEAEAALCR